MFGSKTLANDPTTALATICQQLASLSLPHTSEPGSECSVRFPPASFDHRLASFREIASRKFVAGK